MLTGKAVDRAFIGHLVVDKCLNYQLCSLLEENGKISKEKDSEICKLLDFSLPYYNTIIALNEPDIHGRLGDINNALNQLKDNLSQSSKT